MTDGRQATGGPGIDPRWTSSAKSAVGTSASSASRVWFTMSHCIVDEVYYPSVDVANTRDFGFLVCGPSSYFSEEKRDCASEVDILAPGVPGFRLRNASRDGQYVIDKTVITHPHISSLLQRIVFSPAAPGFRLYALLAPHIRNRGRGNTGWIGDYKGVPMLFARRGPVTIALAASVPFVARTVGYVGSSDGWTDIATHGELTGFFDHAPDGNIALTAEIGAEAGQPFVLALGFGSTTAEAGQVARLSIEQDFDHLVHHFVQDWSIASSDHGLPELAPPSAPLVPISLAVLRTHESKNVPGGFVASLSIPWGNEKGDDDLGGYHLVWPRDLVEIAGGLAAGGDVAAARRAFQFLAITQNADGDWPQNMWLDGAPYWRGSQMDEVGLPIILADQLFQARALGSVDPWPVVRRAASYLVRNGPVTQEDRWEEDPGYSPFTLAVEVAALVVAADFADRAGAHTEATFLRETADQWNTQIERWTYVSGTDLATRLGIDGYYLRIVPGSPDGGIPMARRIVQLKNRDAASTNEAAGAIVSPDALALVRFGLRAADDPRILSTVTAIDALLKSETTTGPTWHRYVDDGYGENEDGSPFDGTGVGRGWPLLAGERGHYELAAGNHAAARSLLETMARQTCEGGLIPEQIWDAADIPEKELFNGKPAGSAMPLAWAHAEYLKLARSLEVGRVVDTPMQVYQRYVIEHTMSNLASWRLNSRRQSIPPGSRLRIEVPVNADVVWTVDDWRSNASCQTADTGLGVHVADLPSDTLPIGTAIEFTFRWLESGNWEGHNFQVVVAGER